jgi:integrase/recombinase XerD
MEVFFSQFVKERKYLRNVSPSTLDAYHWAWRAFEPVLSGRDQVVKADVLQRISELRDAGLTAVSVNTYVRTLNTFLRWLHVEGHISPSLVIPRLKEEQKVPPVFTTVQIASLVAFKPMSKTERRTQAVALLLLDTGLRIDEALNLDRSSDIDLDQLLIKVRCGKGAKGRVVPFSLALRKHLARYMQRQQPAFGSLLFYSGLGDKMVQRNALRDFKLLCAKLEIKDVRCSFHTLRHTFATCYLRNGGDVFRLQRILGHAKLEMTRRYASLQTEDLQAVHQQFSPLTSTRP